MKNVIVLGAGMVSRPLVHYLLNQPDFTVIVASRTVKKAEAVIDGHQDGRALPLNVRDDAKLERLISEADIVVSLLPYTYHMKVALLCVKHRKNMVTTSYVDDTMNRLHQQALDAGIIILNECGLDPGIDHMSAMRVICMVKKHGGKIVSFRSTTGALPSYEANNNPFGYKFSWSPRGVFLASRNSARWLEDGKVISIPGEQLFEHYTLQDVPGVGTFENYPNRDSLSYKDIYGLIDAHTVYRGTFRMTGWCETLRYISRMGWLNDKPLSGFTGKTYKDLTRALVGEEHDRDLMASTAKFLGLKTYSTVLKRFEWLGLFNDEPLPRDENNPLDYLNALTKKKLSFDKNERDMIVMHHEFVVEYPSRQEYKTATLVDYGVPQGDTAVARTVALPAAIAVKMILNKKIKMNGVHIPIYPEVYNPILDELEEIGISFTGQTEQIPP
jgi:saccharopine dehydrogenase-like NADP-dependent oxidoreductase